jgi:hypothetical protein
MPLAEMVCWEPACGEGHMARPLAEYFGEVVASDVHRYGDDHEVFDFTLARFERQRENRPDFVITNPPFRLCADFIVNASAVARVGFAMLVRSAFLEGGERYERIWSVNPPSFVLQFCERVVMLEGRLVRRGDVDPFADKEGGTASSATAYCWLVWLQERGAADPAQPEPRWQSDTRLRWLAPCMARLERAGDYPEYPVERDSLPPPPLFASELPILDLGAAR